MALGREAHTDHQRSQTARGYSSEITVRHKTEVDGFAVTVQGRIDGVFRGEPTVIEEIKSVVLAPLAFASLTPDVHPHYVEQLRLYCHFVAAQEQKPTLGRLVFINVADATRKEFEFAGPFDDCEQLIAERVRILIARAVEEERQHVARRSLAGGLAFPHAKPRRHQDEMIAAVERALASGRHLLVNAPSGIGKTAGALYPVVKEALAHDRRVFFVTAKNTQQAVAMATLRLMGGTSVPLVHNSPADNRDGCPTAVQIQAREKMCINQTYACREEFCPHLQNMTLKVQQTGVLERLLGQRLVTPQMAMDAGRGVSVCPFELALMLAEMTDVIVCDYNYVFDPQVYFRRFFLDEDYSDAVLVIDEAHNLLQRAMDYYSPVLRRRQLHEVGRNLRHLDPRLAKDVRKWLGAIDDVFESLARRQGDEYSQLPDAGTAEKYVIEPPRAHFEDLKATFNKLTVRYQLDKATSGRAIPDDPVEEFFAEFGRYCAALAMDGEEFAHVFDSSRNEALEIVCKDPSRLLAERLDGFHSVVAMSATLAPMDFYRQMLGFDAERTDTLSLPSPFPKENRRIVVVPNVLTTYHARAANYGKIADIIAATAQARRGNYMALFPSYEFLKSVAERLEFSGTGVPPVWAEGIPERTGETPVPLQLLVQTPKMNEAQRAALLSSLHATEPPKLVLAVQGGLFAEGVDFAGEQLIGVIVVSPALPQVSFERELMRRYYDQKYGKGFEFAFLYPGMNRVIQSVGRLIRTETDRGVAVLVCQRFKQTQYTTLFPTDWAETLVEARGAEGLEAELRRFWAGRGAVRTFGQTWNHSVPVA
jgi:DNA excision repair protein ERCC-2